VTAQGKLNNNNNNNPICKVPECQKTSVALNAWTKPEQNTVEQKKSETRSESCAVSPVGKVNSLWQREMQCT